MAGKDQAGGPERLEAIVADARRRRELREQSYREQALRLFPWVCGRCGREFTRNNLSELTVHHRDHDHGNNPPDGSNWELLCVYCHDNEHSRYTDHRAGELQPGGDRHDSATYRPFAGLDRLLKKKT